MKHSIIIHDKKHPASNEEHCDATVVIEALENGLFLIRKNRLDTRKRSAQTRAEIRGMLDRQFFPETSLDKWVGGASVEEEQHRASPSQPLIPADIKRTYKLVSEWYREIIIESPLALLARAYLSGAGIRFTSDSYPLLGFAPSMSGDYWAYACGIPTDELERAGLVYLDEKSHQRVPRFQDRIMVPIRDPRGDVVGFIGRVVSDDDKRTKYLSSTCNEFLSGEARSAAAMVTMELLP